MTLSAGDLTTLVRVQLWLPGSGTGDNPLISSVLISDSSRMIINKLNRARLNSHIYTRTIDGVGNYQIVLPDYPVTSITSIQVGSVLVNPFPLPTPGQPPQFPPLTFGGLLGYRFVPWAGDLPGDPAVVEVLGGSFWYGAQNIKAVYKAGYLVQNEELVIPVTGPYTITALQHQGIWSRDGGVTFSNGVALTSVASSPMTGQYIPPPDPPGALAELGQYTFSAADEGKTVLISYSFVPADLEMACIQLVGEAWSYRDRIGQLGKSLGGQETIRYLRGGIGRGQVFDIPPEVEARIWPYVSVISPKIGAPV